MDNSYKPDVKSFFRPIGIELTLDDIVNEDEKSQQIADILYLDKNDICEINRNLSNDSFNPDFEAEIKASNGYKIKAIHKGKMIAEIPLPFRNGIFSKYYDYYGRLIKPMDFVMESPGNLNEVKDLETGETKYYREQKVSLKGNNVSVFVLRTWWVKEGDTYEITVREVAQQDIIPAKDGNNAKLK